jgi:hypothetical protein
VLGALSAVDSPKALSLALACYEWLQGTAGGVGESSGIDRLTDVPECREESSRKYAQEFPKQPRERPESSPYGECLDCHEWVSLRDLRDAKLGALGGTALLVTIVCFMRKDVQ